MNYCTLIIEQNLSFDKVARFHSYKILLLILRNYFFHNAIDAIL